jgi:hypothetical protein
MNTVTKELVLTASSLIIGTALVGAQPTSAPPANTATSTNALGPKIQFATPVYDFGRARSGEPVKYTYVFTNTGDALLIINSVQPGCGCTSAGEWTKQVEPGKTGSIPIQFNTMGYSTPVVKMITVACNIPSQPPLVYLQLKGTVYTPYVVNPPWAVLNVSPDVETASLVVAITNNTEEPLILSAPESNNRMISAQLITNQPGKEYQLKISTVPPLGTGNIQAQIILRTTWTNTPVIPVTVVANVPPALSVNPSFMTLAAGPLPNAVTNSVTIQNYSTNLVTLSEPVVNVPGVEATIREMQPGKSFAASLAFPQGFQIALGQQVELKMNTSNPKFPVLKVPVIQLSRPVVPAMPAPPAAAVQAPAPAPAPATAPPAAPPVTPVKRLSSTGAGPRPVPPPLPPGL